MGCSFYSSAFSKNRREKKKKKERKEIQRGQTADCCRVVVVDWLLLGDPKKFRRVCMEFSEYNRLTSQRQFAPKCSFLASRPLGHYSFRISWQIPWFLWRHTSRPANLVLEKEKTLGTRFSPSHNSFQGVSNQITWLSDCSSLSSLQETFRSSL